MALEITRIKDPDFPDQFAYQIECPVCHKLFMAQSSGRVKNIYMNHRQVHNGVKAD